MKKKLLLVCFMVGLSFSLIACKGQNKTNPNGTAKETTDGEENGTNTDTSNKEKTNNTETDGKDGEMTDKEEFTPASLSAGGWDFTIEDVLRNKSLKNASVVLGYTDATTSEVEQDASEGNEYFLIKMSISKGDSMDTIKWDKMLLTDSEGNEYHRIEDTFLSDLGMMRMPGTDLNFGTSEGWFAYEVKEGAAGLTLHYQFENETLEYTFE